MIQEADLILDLRTADEEECLAGNMTSEQAIRMSMMASRYSYAVEADGEVLAFWGYGSNTLIAQTAYAWLLTRPAIEEHKFRFIRTSQRIVEYILEEYLEVIVLVHDTHYEARRWLRWLGFLPVPKSDTSPVNFTYFRKAR